MNTRELAVLISEALEDAVRIDTTPTLKKDCASLDCEDEEGNAFVIRVIRVSAEDETDSEEDSDDDGEIIVVEDTDDVS